MMMKSSKYTQANSPNDNDYRDYQNTGTILQPEPNLNRTSRPGEDAHLKYDFHPENFRELQRLEAERNANYPLVQPPQEFEMQCKCVKDTTTTSSAIPHRQHHLHHHHHHQRVPKYSSEQNIVLANQNYNSLTRLDNSSQYSLDRKAGKSGKKQHTYTCEQNQRILQRLERAGGGGAVLPKRVQSPEVINIHRAPGYVPENTYGYDKEFKCDDYGFRRVPSFKRQAGDRANGGQPKRRAAGDGMDSEMDDPELIFEVSDQARECPCACDHVIYGPGYTNCLQVWKTNGWT